MTQLEYFNLIVYFLDHLASPDFNAGGNFIIRFVFRLNLKELNFECFFKAMENWGLVIYK